MKSIATFALLGAAGATKLAGERDLSGYTYQQYVRDFGKSYGATEHSSRQAIFESNMGKIVEQNAQEDKSWFADVNQFTDMTNDEFNMDYHGHSPHPAGTFDKPDLTAFEPQALPDSVDWRTVEGVVTKVKDQGQCGSCWAFSAVETLESHYALRKSPPEKAPEMSPQEIVSCAPNPDHCGGAGGCDGSTQPLAFNYTMNHGISQEFTYPYRGITGTCNTETFPIASNTGYVQLTINNYTELVTAVANVGPVSISVAAGGIGWQLYGGGVYSTGGDYVMDHAVQLVGYGNDNGKMYWWVRNSWGGRWGEDGYMRIERFGEGQEPCGIDKKPQDGDACQGDTDPVEYCGLCGILSSSSYPTGVKHCVGGEC